MIRGATCNLKSISVTDKMVYEIDHAMIMARELGKQVARQVWAEIPDIIVIEYPVLATRSGSYLGLLQQGILDAIFAEKDYTRPDIIYYLLPAQAVNSVTRAKNKTGIITWCKEHMKLTVKMNHDEATAAVLAYTGLNIYNKAYKNSYKKIMI